jgi:cytochrome b561
MALHWGTAIAIVAGVSAMLLRDAAEDRLVRQILLDIHRQIGLLVLMGVVVRLGVRLHTPLMDNAADMPALLRGAARASHVLLYALLAAMPISGWLVTNAHGIRLSLFGVVPLPNLIQDDSELADTLSDYHVWLAWVLLGFVSVHALAALWHHFIRRDNVLRAMCPEWLQRPRRPPPMRVRGHRAVAKR